MWRINSQNPTFYWPSQCFKKVSIRLGENIHLHMKV